MAAYLGASILGALLSVGVLAFLGSFTLWIPTRVVIILLGAATVVAAFRDLSWVRLPLPQNQRLVPRTAIRKRPHLVALQFGFELGTGVRTYLNATAPYLLALAVLLARPSLDGVLLAAAGFGLGRTLGFLFHACGSERVADIEDRLRANPAKALLGIGCGVLVIIALSIN